MDKEQIIPWVERMKAEPDGKKRNEIVAELCKENGLKTGDALKLLKEAGFDPIITWIERLNTEPDKGKRNEIVADISNEIGLKPGDVWKLLKEAGFNPKASPNGNQNNNNNDDSDQDTEKVTVLASHKTDYEKYRCAGLVLTRKPENYLVTEAQLKKLKRDPWVVVSK